ncbi:hypothetical protein BSK66_15770 [Paenibacillus odorifer]|uniref:Uncharacterized protein n=1 Tax=Paenibacillus odorifer TaxID=189426 RepID=A0A1R0X0A7_9BACL|nr:MULTISPECIES: hypothetical protein [Paenibacillus]ETT55214.1 hypothetical protein C171_19542 [Paenibacillus sp. FSL H8-237]OMD25448.1 hypothetical protein BJP51_04155 [Paenibacillus odorifer]OME56309.1 hypothetical protein BSK66_15770 [Paenibacillus odorifer]
MIEWKKYKPLSPPEQDTKYLISDGLFTDFAYFFIDPNGDQYWCPNDNGPIENDQVRFYAEINRPDFGEAQP